MKVVLLSHERYLVVVPFLLSWGGGRKVDAMDFSTTAVLIDANVSGVEMNVNKLRGGYGVDEVLVDINFIGDYLS